MPVYTGLAAYAVSIFFRDNARYNAIVVNMVGVSLRGMPETVLAYLFLQCLVGLIISVGVLALLWFHLKISILGITTLGYIKAEEQLKKAGKIDPSLHNLSASRKVLSVIKARISLLTARKKNEDVSMTMTAPSAAPAPQSPPISSIANTSECSPHPIAVQAVSTGGLFIVGDILAQQGVERKGVSNHDVSRTLRLALYGGLIGCALVSVLAENCVVQERVESVLGRVALDQIVFAPAFIGLFISSTTLMSGQSLADVKARLNDGYREVVINNWKVWPAVQIVNFAFVPLLYRSLVVNTIATGWNTYLSLLTSRWDSSSKSE
ncbi:Protein required for ethanol metabolism [Chytriomyces hyalinus]|nr:Protein required for ethanol metabolism [Chytriomyces hyalinus]